jgi:hypothetical protein
VNSMSELIQEAMRGVRVVSDSDVLDRERRDRIVDSSETLSRLPDFLRRVPGAELFSRVARPELAAAVRPWRLDSGSLILIGATSTGKTSAAGWLFRRLVHDGVKLGGEAWSFARGLHWYSAKELDDGRRAHPLGKGDAPELTNASHASLLFLDDCGWERDPAAVSDVLNARYELGRQTVITSGRTQQGLTELYGGAVLRRLVESGGRASTLVDLFGSEKL